MNITYDHLRPGDHALDWTLDDDTIRVEFRGVQGGFIRFEYNLPLILRGPEAELVELEYCQHRFGPNVWELTIPELPSPRSFTLTIDAIPPPAEPVVDTPSDIERFRRAFDARPSRFPDESTDAFRTWQDEMRQKCWGWLMRGSRPEQVALELELTEIGRGDGFTLFDLKHRARNERSVESLLALPDRANAETVPLLLALHGHEAEWGVADSAAFEQGHVDDFCHHFATNGWAVLQPPTMDHVLKDDDWTLYGEWCWDAITALDAVAEHPRIDMTRVGLIGLSTGGSLATVISALDPRIRATVAGGCFSTYNHFLTRDREPGGCNCGATQYLFSRLEPADLVALSTPRPMQIQHGQQDTCLWPGADPAELPLHHTTGLIPWDEFNYAYAEVERAYRICHAEDRVDLHVHPGGHGIDNDAALAWMTGWFKATGGRGRPPFIE